MAKHSIQITDSKLYESIVEYCKENGLKVSSLCTDMLRKQFLIEKFGDIPFGELYNADEDKVTTMAIVKKEDNNGDYENSTPTEIQTDKDEENKAFKVIGIQNSFEQPLSEVVFAPFKMGEAKTLTGTTISDKYTTPTPVDPSFYKEIQKHTEKPKKRRL